MKLKVASYYSGAHRDNPHRIGQMSPNTNALFVLYVRKSAKALA